MTGESRKSERQSCLPLPVNPSVPRERARGKTGRGRRRRWGVVVKEKEFQLLVIRTDGPSPRVSSQRQMREQQPPFLTRSRSYFPYSSPVVEALARDPSVRTFSLLLRPPHPVLATRRGYGSQFPARLVGTPHLHLFHFLPPS